MLTKITTVLFAALVLASASLTFAADASAAPHSFPHNPDYYGCQTDEGYGRHNPCDAGGG